MTSLTHELMQFVWLALSLLIGAIQITAAMLLLCHRGAGPWMMLAGAALGMLTNLAHHGIIFIANARNLWNPDSAGVYQKILPVLGMVGSFAWILFGAGLLILAFRLRGLSRHAAELEAALAARR